MKSQLNILRSIRFEEELDRAIIKASNLPADASDSVRSRQFSKTVRRLCRQALSGSHQVHDLENTLNQLETIRKQIAPIGSNLNQIATGFNLDGHLYGEDLAGVHSDLQTQFKEMTDVLKELRKKLITQLN